MTAPFSGSLSFSRASSHTMPSPLPGISKSDANPCSCCVRSWWGVNGLDQVFPASREYDIHMSYPSFSTFVFRYQCATSVPSPIPVTAGTSAQLTNQLLPESAVCAGDQAPPFNSENFSVLVFSPCSSQ